MSAQPHTFGDAAALLARAARPEDVFGPVHGDRETARRTFRHLAGLVHPDVAPVGEQASATAAFAALARLYAAFTRAARAPALAGTAPARSRVATRRHAILVGDLLARGDVANVYAAEATRTPATSGRPRRAVLKWGRHPRNNDLLDVEAEALRRLAAEGDPAFAAYTPRLLESFILRDDTTGIDRHANLLARLDGFVTLADAAAAFPAGLDPRDAAWMWRRLLVALGAVHRVGIVHGAVTPEHVLIHPRLHGLVLVDFCFAVLDAGGIVPAITTGYADLYPREVLQKRCASPATDIFMASRTMRALMSSRAPAPLRAFADGCSLDAPGMRPQDAWALKDELDDLLERLYGRRRFRPFVMPAPTT